MATLELQIEIRDEDEKLDEFGNMMLGHIWYLFDPIDPGDNEMLNLAVERCSCGEIASWLRTSMEHPNYCSQIAFCGTCASDKLRRVPATVWAVIYGLEFGYAWEEPIYQDKEGADR